MRVHLAGSGVRPEHSAGPIFAAQLAAQRDPLRHCLTEDPGRADVVLFPDCHLAGADWQLGAVASSEIARAYPDKVAVYNERDRPWCRFPGIYVSMPASGFAPRWQVAAGYFSLEAPAARAGREPESVEPDLLYSFIGGSTHPCRNHIFALGSSAGERAHVENTDGFLFHDRGSDRFEERRARFAEVMLRSKFVLCPRGHGTSSFRLYETMSSGRVPVIIADEWVPPPGPTWDRISIRWPEDRIADLPRHLASREDEAPALGAAAQQAYDEWFARDVILTHQLDQLAGLLVGGGFTGFPRGGVRNVQYLRTVRGVLAGRAKVLAGRAKALAHR